MLKKIITLEILMFCMAIFAVLSFFPKAKASPPPAYKNQDFEPSQEEKIRRTLLRINVQISKGEVIIKEKKLDGSN